MHHDQLRGQFPKLFLKSIQGSLIIRFELLETLPPAALVSNVNMVPRVGERWLVIVDHQGDWDISGGTVEVGEAYMETLRRELMEEAGAKLVSWRLFGAFHYRSTVREPYRPHVPHPEFYRLVGVGDVDVTATPADPDGHVRTAKLVPLEDVVRRFRGQGRDDLAALYQIGAEISGYEERI
jgi:8-oxo-dGTP pyrophosphatase MutT (NUDIX family)